MDKDVFKSWKESSLEHLFRAAAEFVLMSGGDGWALIASQNYRDIADRFEQVGGANSGWFSERWDREDSVSFVHEQEGITFCSIEYYDSAVSAGYGPYEFAAKLMW